MRAAIIKAPRLIEIEEVPLPLPGPGEVRVRLEGCGICGSNLPVWQGRPWFNYPWEPGGPGHEGWGVIDAVGSGVTRFRPGERVAMLSCHAFAECDVAAQDSVIHLPEALAGRPMPGEPLGCAMNVFTRSEVQAGQTVAVVGVGFLGLLLVQLAAQAGARVIGLGRRGSALDMARQLGASHVFALEPGERALNYVNELTSGRGCERVIEAVGAQAPLDLAGQLACERGRLIIAGYHQDGLRQVNMQLWNWRGLDVINAHERDPQQYLAGMQAAADALLASRLDPTPLFTHSYPLEQINQGFIAMEERPKNFFKGLVRL